MLAAIVLSLFAARVLLARADRVASAPDATLALLAPGTANSGA